MNIKKIFCSVAVMSGLFFFLSGTAAIAQSVPEETILLAAPVCFGSQGESLNIDRELKKSFFEALEKFNYGNEVSFKRISKYGTVLSVTDAAKVVNAEEVRFLVYGYVQKNDSCWFSDLKLYDGRNGCVTEKFFAAESFENLERLLELQAHKIDEKIRDLYGFTEKVTNREVFPSFVQYEGSVFYWSPVDLDWSKRIIGTAGIDGGVEYFPSGSAVVYKNRNIFFAGKLLFEYRYGTGNPDYYSASLHSLMFKNPVTAVYEISAERNIYFGLGPYYQLDFLLVDKKYENTTLHLQNQWGLDFEGGVLFETSPGLKLNTGLEVNIPFAKESFVSVKPKLGLVFRPGAGEENHEEIF